MTLTYLDWCWNALYFAINGGIGLYYRSRAGKSVLLFGEWATGAWLLAVGLAGGAVIYWDLSRRGWSSVVD